MWMVAASLAQHILDDFYKSQIMSSEKFLARLVIQNAKKYAIHY